MKIVFFDHALFKYSLTQTLTIYMYKSESEEKLLFPSPPHQGALVARVECQHLFGPIWQDSDVSVTYITIFTDQSHIMLLFLPPIKVILIKLSEINVGKHANPITSKQAQVHSSTEPLPEVKLGSTGPQLIKSFGHSYTTITDSISDLIQVLLWNDIDSCLKWSLLIIPLGEDTEDPVEGGKKG